ncbi:MAG: hypothetical protein ITG02_02890 [Patulibacter sp.]|nr:hypothetical protein [Patulibacter sp.]
MRSTRVFSLATAAVLALAVTGCGGTTFQKDEPQTAVRDFLSEALSQKNGQRACDFMTVEAQGELVAGASEGANCRMAMELSGLISGGEPVRDVASVKDLDYEVTADDGETATVVVTPEGGEAIEFALMKSEGLGALYEPETPWRITGGAKPLIVGVEF